jgi:thiol:disulfide interchange protein DsbC
MKSQSAGTNRRSFIPLLAAVFLASALFLLNSYGIQAFDRNRYETNCQKCHILPNQRVDFSKIPLDQALVMGDVLAPQKVVVFTDPDSPYCQELHKEMEKVLQERKDIAFYIILYPLRFHKDAYWKSKSILCSKSLKMLEDAYAGKEIPRLECDPREIDANIRLAEALGITGTPTLVLPDGRIRNGSMPAQQLIDFIQGSR